MSTKPREHPDWSPSRQQKNKFRGRTEGKGGGEKIILLWTSYTEAPFSEMTVEVIFDVLQSCARRRIFEVCWRNVHWIQFPVASSDSSYLSGEHDGDDEPVDGDCLAEDDGDEVLRLDPGRLDAAAEDGAARGVDAEGGADDGERDGKPDAERRPHVRRRLGEEPAKVDAFPPTGELKVSSSVSA